MAFGRLRSHDMVQGFRVSDDVKGPVEFGKLRNTASTAVLEEIRGGNETGDLI